MKIWFVAVVLLSSTALYSEAQKVQDKSVGATASQEEVPPARTVYKGREIAQTMHWLGASWLLRKTREREESAKEMLRELNVQEGMAVCDLGCGNGFHTLELSKMVGPTGRVVAVDIQEEMLEMLQVRAKKVGATNITTVLGKFHDPMLKPNTLDMVLVVDAYHEFSHPELMLKAIHRALKKDGLLVLVEFRAEDKTVPIKEEHKMSKAQVDKELTPNGYQLVRSYDKLPWQHLLFYGKSPAGDK